MSCRAASILGVVGFALALAGAAPASLAASACEAAWTLGGERPGAPPRSGGPAPDGLALEIQLDTGPDGVVHAVAAHLWKRATMEAVQRRLHADRAFFLGCQPRTADDGRRGRVCETLLWGACPYHAILQEWTLGDERHLALFLYEGAPDAIERRPFSPDESELLDIEPD